MVRAIPQEEKESSDKIHELTRTNVGEGAQVQAKYHMHAWELASCYIILKHYVTEQSMRFDLIADRVDPTRLVVRCMRISPRYYSVFFV